MSRVVSDLLFGSAVGIEETAERITDATGVVFEWHDSDWRGGSYLLGGDWRTPNSEEIIVQRNEDFGDVAEDVEAPTLVYVQTTDRAEALIEALTPQLLVLIRREQRDTP